LQLGKDGQDFLNVMIRTVVSITLTILVIGQDLFSQDIDQFLNGDDTGSDATGR
jgi:hypothetical protein